MGGREIFSVTDGVYLTMQLAEQQVDPHGKQSKVFDSYSVPSTSGKNSILRSASMFAEHFESFPERSAADEGVHLISTKNHPPEYQVLSSLCNNVEAGAEAAVDDGEHDQPSTDLLHLAAGVNVNAFVSPMDIHSHGYPVIQIFEGISDVINVTSKLPCDRLSGLKDLKADHLYNLMHIKSDKQDLSFVEKVLLPQAGVVNLCNLFMPGSARFLDDESTQPIINFDVLNRVSVHSVGYYGNKIVMMEIFRKVGIIADHQTLEQMREGKLQPGLYVAVHEDTLHIFYWHRGERLSDASRNDISCNFIRYLVELCRIVHVCLDATHGLESSLLSGTTITKPARTQRFKLFVKKSSDNDLEVHPGYEIDISAAMATGSGKVSGFQLTEGYHAAAFLVATAIPPKKSMKTDEVNLKREKLASLVKRWESEFNLDVSKLDDRQFTLFLEATESSGYKELCDLKQESKKLQELQARKTYDLDGLVSEQQQLALRIFEKALSTYLQLEFYWEENLLSDTGNLEGVHLSPQTEGNQAVSQGSICYGESAPNQGEDGNMKFDETEGSYSLEQEFSALWTRRQATAPAELLFCDSEIRLMLSANEPFSFVDGCEIYRIYKCTQSSHFGLILYGETCILEYPGSKPYGIQVKCLAQNGVLDQVGPVVISEPLILEVLHHRRPSKFIPINGGVQVHKSLEPDPLMACMGAMAKSTVIHLYRKASLVNPCLTKVKEQLASKDRDLVDHALQRLISAMLSDNLGGVLRDTKLQKDHIDKIKKSWGALMRGEKLGYMKVPEISTAVKQACVSLHKKRRDIYVSKVKTTVINEIVPLLKQKIEAELKIQMETLEKQSREEEVAFIGNLRKSYMTVKEDLPTLSLLSCTGKILERQIWQKIKDGVKRAVLGTEADPETTFSITYSREVSDKEDMTWNAVDLAPNKKDLEILSTNPAHVVTLGLNQMAVKLIDANSTQTRLAKVVYLKSGQVLTFLEKIDGDPLLTIYRCSTLASVHETSRPIKELRRHVDEMAFDETSKYVALYAKNQAIIQIYIFDETYTNMDPAGIHLNLAEYTGSHNIIWLGFVPGNRELVLVDAADCVRLFEFTQSVMMRPRQIQLPFHFAKACIPADGSYLILFRLIDKPDPSTIQLAAEADCDAHNEAAACADTSKVALTGRFLALEIYRLESMRHLKTLDVGMRVDDLNTLQANVVVFGTQMQLLIHDSSRPDVIWSQVLESRSASEVRKMMKVQNNNPAVLHQTLPQPPLRPLSRSLAQS